MRKFIFLFFLTFLFGKNDICFDLRLDKSIFQKFKKENPYLYEDDVEKNLKKLVFFAKKYNKKDKISIAKLASIKALYNAYRNELISKYSPNEKVIKSFYEEYKEFFKPTIKVSFSSIQLLNLDLADKLYKELKKNPNKFDIIAKKYSLRDIIKYKDVSLGNFDFKMREMIRNAKKNDILPPVKIGEYYYIDRIDKKEFIKPTYENLKPKIKKILVNIYVNKLMDRMYKEK